MELKPITWTIYLHTHIASGRCYIGLTKKTMMRRWKDHVYSSQHSPGGKSITSHFANAIRKYGKDAFSHQVLDQTDNLDHANFLEEKWIEILDTRDPRFGFNIKRGGAHTPHPIRNPWDRPEFRKKNAGRNTAALLTPAARAAQKASLNTPESKAKRSAATKAAMARPEVQAKRRIFQNDSNYRTRISESCKSVHTRPEVKAKVLAANREINSRLGHREKVVISTKITMARPDVKERWRSAVKIAQNRPEVIEKHRAYRASLETKAKISAASKGRKHTLESIEKQRRLYLQRSSFCKFCDHHIDGKRACINGRVSCHSCLELHQQKLASFIRPDRSFLI